MTLPPAATAFMLKQVSPSDTDAFVISGTALCLGGREYSYIVKNHTQKISVSVPVHYCPFPPNQLFIPGEKEYIYTQINK